MKISVALAAYNGAKYITQQLDSIRQQTRLPDEVVVVDDCSADGTWEILQDYAGRYPAFPLHLEQNTHNTGFKENFRRALTLCSGDIQFLCDQDDIWNPDKVERMTALLEKRPDIQSVASSFTLIDGAGQVWIRKHRAGWSNQNLYHRNVRTGAAVRVRLPEISFHNFCQGCALAFRRELREEYLEEYTDKLPHDWLLNLLAAGEHGLFFYNVPLFQYRVHEGNAIGLVVNTDEQTKMGAEYRTLEARQAETFLRLCRERYPDAFLEEKELSEREQFLENYLQAMEQHRSGALLSYWKSPYYRELKAARGRLGDLLFVMRGK